MENVKLYRSVSNRMVGGVSGGLGAYLNIDPIFIRLLFVLIFFGTGLLYPVFETEIVYSPGSILFILYSPF